MFLLFVTILLCLLPQARSGECDTSKRGFKRNRQTVKAIRDCAAVQNMRLSWLVFPLLVVSTQQNKQEKQTCFWSCPKGWEEYKNYCFLWPNGWKSWENAEEYCKNKDGHLASVTNQNIHDYLLSKINIGSYNPYWIGGTDKKEEGKWLWSDGNPWNFSLWSKEPRQPDNHFPGENCLKIDNHGTPDGWNDDNCERVAKFVCSQRICQNLRTLENETSSAGGKNGLIVR